MKFINVTDWVRDEHHSVFPVGARDKEMIWSPEGKSVDLKTKWPYLFKESIYRYPDQYWTEIVAYIVSKYLSLDVPKALPAFKETNEGVICGALIEWFYNVETDRFMDGGTYFKRLIPEFDVKTGRQHNIKDLLLFLKVLDKNETLDMAYISSLADMILFDELIGNTDRHQENWGVVFKKDDSVQLKLLFDNGTSLGHERLPDRVESWGKDRIEAYVRRGRHHLRYDRHNTENRIKHFELIDTLARKDDVKEYMRTKLNSLSMDALLSEVYSLTTIKSVVPFEVRRFNWIKKILEVRIELIREELK
ncbi:MAG: hypothetical protein HRT88_14605 [Lentisphaeraceae bacterium]|nr:hypothetical protein [Lentisphaeraceae bacterium]